MTQLNFNVRPIQERDFPEWLRLRKLLWDQSTDEEHQDEMIDILEHPETQLVLVAETANGRLAGFLEASIRPFVEDCHTDQVGYLEGWFVERDFRRRGIGRRLVKAAEDWARSKGCEEMASDSEIGNELSLLTHLKFGYEETSRLVHLRKDLV
jgi:aminoglycoside 6'-N-acetyltransferase I